MSSNPRRRGASAFTILIAASFLTLPMTGCSATPKAENQAAFLESASASRTWFESNVNGLHDQIESAEAYVVFPDIAQWGIIFTGGKFGRGALLRPDGSQIGWGAINTGSIGLQAGVQGFKMLVVIENKMALEKFMSDSWTGSAEAVAVVAETGGNAVAPFRNGTSVYTGANQGVMAGASVGLQYIRYKPLEDD